MGILVCGLNGCGKSTLGRALARELGCHFIDNEDLFFERPRADAPYSNPRSRETVAGLLMEEVRKHPDFVFAAVKGDYGEEILPFYDLAILIEVPREIRLRRVRNRSHQKFGDRMMPGGDMYLQEEQFFRLVESRPEDLVERWLQCLRCPVIRVDGTKPVAENVAWIHSVIRRNTLLPIALREQ